jgi:hypothetical protein
VAKFQIGIAIEQTRETVVVVEVEAADLKAAERIAEDYVREETHKPFAGALSGLSSWVEWSDGRFTCMGVDHEEPWGNGDYTTDIEVPEDFQKQAQK